MEGFKPAWHQRNAMLAVTALVISLAVHLIFSLTIRQVSDRTVEDHSSRGHVALLTCDQQDPQKRQEWHQLCRWFSENAPTITADTNSPYSYSSLHVPVNPGQKRQPVDHLKFPSPIPRPVAKPLADDKLQLPAVEDLAQRRWQESSRTALPETRFSAFDENMRPVALPALGELLKQRRPPKQQPNAKPLPPTRIIWHSRVPEVAASSGDPELDRLALTAVSVLRHRPEKSRRYVVYWHWPAATGAKEGL